MISFIETVVRLCVWIGHRRVTTSDERSFVRKILFEYWPWYVLENKETTKEQRGSFRSKNFPFHSFPHEAELTIRFK